MSVSPIEDERPPVSSPMREKLKDKEEGKERKGQVHKHRIMSSVSNVHTQVTISRGGE